MSMAFQAFIHRAKIVRSRRPFRSCFEVGGGVDFLKSARKGGPISPAANSCAGASVQNTLSLIRVARFIDTRMEGRRSHKRTREQTVAEKSEVRR